MQVLQLSDGTKLDIDTEFQQGEIPARYDMSTGFKTLIEATPAPPRIRMKGTAFFYENGDPVTDPAHVPQSPTWSKADVPWIPDRMVAPGGKIVNPRALLIAFVEAQQEAAPVRRAKVPASKKLRPRAPAEEVVKPFDPRAALGAEA